MTRTHARKASLAGGPGGRRWQRSPARSDAQRPLAIGLALAIGLERVLRSLLHEIDSLPLGVFAAALAGLAAVALASGLVPAHRASRIHPMEALRHK